MLAFYGVSFGELMELPIKTFWLMNDSIDRISAKSDMRSLTIAACSQSGESATSHRERLVLEVGTMVKLDDDPIKNAVRDQGGFDELRKMATQ